MEAEEREVQSAKLQELIRRGTPADLQEANRLMKVMTGYDTRTKTDYRAKAAEDIAKIQAKARLLEERLESHNPADGEVLEELARALQSAQPKIQKMCEEESDDHEAVARLLEINDSIHRTTERYRLIKKGDMEGAAKIARGAPLPEAGSSKAAGAELSLIDFDADAETEAATGNNNGTAASSSSPQPGGLENDLLGLNIGDPVPMSYGQAGDIALGFGANQSKFHPTSLVANSSNDDKAPMCQRTVSDQSSGIPGPALISTVTENNRAKASSPAFSSFTSPPVSSSATPQPAADPFASLIGISSPSATPTPPAAAPAAAAATSNDDDEWDFESALPPDVPQEHSAIVCNTGLTINLHASRKLGPNAMCLFFQFSNNTADQFEELHYQLAAPKVRLPPPRIASGQVGRRVAGPSSGGLIY